MNTKKLKQLVLDLAIHGKLVPQDPNDEPASELLKRIKEEKVKIKRIKTSFNENVLDDVPFVIPKNWCWCRLGSLLNIFGRIGFRGYTKEDLVGKGEGAITLSPSNIIDNKMDYTDCTYISWNKYLESPEIQVFNGDILVVKTGSSFGKCSLVKDLKEKATINPQFVVLKDIKCDNKYLTFLLQSKYARSLYDEFVLGTAIPTFTQVKLAEMYIPIPPLSEQKRIVSAIEKWFAVIDQIESNEADLRKSIEQTKKKVLNLAIHGKLVEQDENDEPASELLKRIKEEKAKTAKSKKAIADVEIDEVPFELPKGWVWCLLPDLCSIPITDGTHQTPTYSDKENGIPFLSSKDVTSRRINWTNIKYITKGLHEELYKRIAPQKDDILLAKNGTTGVAAIVEDDRVFDIYVTLAVIRPISKIVFPLYLLHVINSGFCKEQFNSHLTGIGLPNLHLTDIKKTIIPLPPLAEQKRIVAKVEEVMGELDKMMEMMG